MGKESEYNAHRLLWAGFMAILAAGVGFSIRGGILADWGSDFGFTKSQLGAITGGGLTGFGIVILLGSLLADKIGYGRLMFSAFGAHILSAVLTLAASPIYAAMVNSNPELAKILAYQCLYWGMFLFAIGNGIAEAVVNPLVAALFPEQKTHYLNILHAGWPGGLVVGGLASTFMVGKVDWEIQIALFLIPTALYGIMMLGQKFPKSEAGESGVGYGDMLQQLGMLGAAVICLLLTLFFASNVFPAFASWGTPMIWVVSSLIGAALLLAFGAVTRFSLGPPMLAFLLVIHALVGYVELGTDSWITNITGTIMANRSLGLILFVWTSSLMFALRFFAGPIVHKISPLGLLFASAVAGSIGLLLLGNATGILFCFVAATIYGFGKTYFWPTMLGVVSERYPKGGAITIGSIGGVGMLSAGLLGAPAIGYKQDFYAQKTLRDDAPAVYNDYKTGDDTPRRFLFFPAIEGLDPVKVELVKAEQGMIGGNEMAVAKILGEKVGETDAPSDRKLTDEEQTKIIEALDGLWEFTEQEQTDMDEKDGDADDPYTDKENLEMAVQSAITKIKETEDMADLDLTDAEKQFFVINEDKEQVLNADLQGAKSALLVTALIPATMGVCYLILIGLFAMQGGYKALKIEDEA